MFGTATFAVTNAADVPTYDFINKYNRKEGVMAQEKSSKYKRKILPGYLYLTFPGILG